MQRPKPYAPPQTLPQTAATPSPTPEARMVGVRVPFVRECALTRILFTRTHVHFCTKALFVLSLAIAEG